jgi:AcrR family transcriptional regulator
MCNKELDTKQVILNAAEEEFLDKGFGNAKMMAIAKRAGVSHSMLHYHFQTKENLFQMIFQQKIQTLSQLFEGIDVQHLPFKDTIRLFVEYQFLFIAQSPRLPLFMMNEIIADKQNLKLVIETVKPQISEIFGKLKKMLDEEIEKGAIRPIKFHHLIMNILSMNISTFPALPLFEELIPDFDDEKKEAILNERRECNVQFILKALQSS